MPEKSRAEKYRELHPDPLTPEWMDNKADGMIHDSETLLNQMNSEASERFAYKLEALLKQYRKKRPKSASELK